MRRSGCHDELNGTCGPSIGLEGPGYGRAIRTFCGRVSCPCCGPYRRAEWELFLAPRLLEAEQIARAEVPLERWPTVQRRIQRRGGRFVWAKCDPQGEVISVLTDCPQAFAGLGSHELTGAERERVLVELLEGVCRPALEEQRNVRLIGASRPWTAPRERSSEKRPEERVVGYARGGVEDLAEVAREYGCEVELAEPLDLEQAPSFEREHRRCRFWASSANVRQMVFLRAGFKYMRREARREAS